MWVYVRKYSFPRTPETGVRFPVAGVLSLTWVLGTESFKDQQVLLTTDQLFGPILSLLKVSVFCLCCVCMCGVFVCVCVLLLCGCQSAGIS